MARPGQVFSENQGPPWTPEVWRVGPEALVAQARAQLWSERADVNSVLEDSGEKGTIAGPNPSDSNERYEQIAEATPNQGSRQKNWSDAVRQMHDTTPTMTSSN